VFLAFGFEGRFATVERVFPFRDQKERLFSSWLLLALQ
jgi:hypothetical protein